MYTTGRVPARVRGQLAFLFQLALTFGIVVSYVIDLWFASVGLSWRAMFGVAVFPALALIIGMYFLTDTPRWYASKGHWDRAYQAMLQASGDETETRSEVQRIRRALELEGRSHPLEFLRPGLRLALVVGVGMAVLQQFVGINTIIYYAPIVLGSTGIGQAGNPLIGALIVGIVRSDSHVDDTVQVEVLMSGSTSFAPMSRETGLTAPASPLMKLIAALSCDPRY
jgi:MFS family permease